MLYLEAVVSIACSGARSVQGSLCEAWWRCLVLMSLHSIPHLHPLHRYSYTSSHCISQRCSEIRRNPSSHQIPSIQSLRACGLTAKPIYQCFWRRHGQMSCSLSCNTPCHAFGQVLAACTHLLVSAVRFREPTPASATVVCHPGGAHALALAPPTASKATCV